ncbi:hypothetical protein [Streptomyces sp. WAC08241]|uniref:hypothetical protein n=1 Tax=Streptomyces sp. WAC08241 TaxID=2487421 RepID=UPI000F7A47B2|nr:hypothetical protein [Streptomyces sp. WAC08241]RSS41219.1 hypothetical protein EF906_15065 [Streptomyces sp. WAC08241]
MGYGVSLHRFVGGEPEVLDDRVIRDVLAPHVARAGRDAGELLVRAADGGEAEVDVSATGVDVHRFPSGGVVHLVAELAARLGAAVVLPDGVLVGDEEQRANLPDGLREAAVVIEMTGSGLRGALDG